MCNSIKGIINKSQKQLKILSPPYIFSTLGLLIKNGIIQMSQEKLRL